MLLWLLFIMVLCLFELLFIMLLLLLSLLFLVWLLVSLLSLPFVWLCVCFFFVCYDVVYSVVVCVIVDYDRGIVFISFRVVVCVVVGFVFCFLCCCCWCCRCYFWFVWCCCWVV